MIRTRLDYEKLHRHILIKLKAIKKPQRYLSEKQGFSRDTVKRLSKGNEIRMITFFKMVDWLEAEPEDYFIFRRRQKK